MKKVVLFLVCLMFTGSVYALDITFTIPADKVGRVVNAMEGLYPIPANEAGEPLFTDAQWAKEAVRRWIVYSVQRWEKAVAAQAAQNNIEADNAIAQ